MRTKRDRRAFVDGADRIDHAGGGRHRIGAGGELLDHRSVRLREDEVDLDIGGVEIAVLDGDMERPEIGRGGVDRADRDEVGGAGVQRRQRDGRGEDETLQHRFAHNGASQSVIWVTPGRTTLSTSSAPGRSPRLSIALASALSFARDTLPVGSKKCPSRKNL